MPCFFSFIIVFSDTQKARDARNVMLFGETNFLLVAILYIRFQKIGPHLESTFALVIGILAFFSLILLNSQNNSKLTMKLTKESLNK
jgi:hypothetical protein